MRRFRKILSIIILFLFVLIPIKTNALEPTEIESMNHLEHFDLLVKNIDRTNEHYFRTGNLSLAQQDLYRTFLEHFKEKYSNYKKAITWTVDLEDDLDSSEIQEVANAFFGDYKIFFWLTGEGGYKFYSSTEVNYEFNFALVDIYSDEAEFRRDLKEIVYNREVIKNLVDQESNTYSKVKVLHDWLANNNTYLKDGDVSHTPAGALVQRHGPVCEAYSEAFQMVANYVGIISVYGTGTVPRSQADIDDGSGDEDIGHAWNYVYLYDKWYFVDTTWAVPSGGSLNYKYFLTTIPSSHSPSEDVVIPQPFTTQAYNNLNLVEFEYDSDFYYEKTGSPILGYNSVTTKGLLTPTLSYKYFTINGTTLSGAPSEFGKYYVVVYPTQTNIFKGDIIIHFEIVPLMHTVIYYDYFNNVVKTEKVLDGEAAKPFELEEHGYKFINWDQDLSKVNGDLEVRPVYKEVEIKFFDETGKDLEIVLDELSKEAIENINYNPNNDNLFISWGQDGKIVIFGDKITDDYNLKPIVETVEFTIEKSKLKDGIYKLDKNHYKKETISLKSDNQIIISQEIVKEIDENNNYQIKLIIGSKYSNAEYIILVDLEATNTLILGLTTSQVILYSIIAVGALIIIGTSISVIKKRRA